MEWKQLHVRMITEEEPIFGYRQLLQTMSVRVCVCVVM